MRFVADESCDFLLVRTLRDSGHDVVAISEIAPRAEDAHVLELSAREERILLTEDKDFGQLVYAGQRRTGGVILIRFPATARKAMAKTVLDLVSNKGETLTGRFVVVEPGRIRMRGQE